jgi:hypothetical protein
MKKTVDLTIISPLEGVKKGHMKVLSLEGAPCRGLGQIEIMKKISKIRSVQFDQDFDVYIGSSWGAVLALCLSMKIPMDQIEKAFEESQTYLNSRAHRFFSLFFPRMCPEKVLAPFISFFEDLSFKDVKKRVICHCYDIESKQIITLDSANKSDHDLKLKDLLHRITFAPSLYLPKMNSSIIDVSMAMRNPLFYTLIRFYNEFKGEAMDILHIGVGQKRQEGAKVRKLFERGWIHWVFSKQIFNEIDSIGRVYQDFLVEMVQSSNAFRSFKCVKIDPLIDGRLDFSFMGDMSLTPQEIRKEVEGWMEKFPIDHLEY